MILRSQPCKREPSGPHPPAGERRRALRTIEPETLELTVASGTQRGEHFAGANQSRSPYRPPNRTTASAVRAGRVWVTNGNAQTEQMMSGLPPKPDIRSAY